jgi:DNA-binding MarR family transcriptional regulator
MARPARNEAVKRSAPTRTKPAATRQASAAKPAAPARSATKVPAVLTKSETGAEINLGYLTEFVGFHLRLAQDASYRVFSKHRDKDLVKPGRFPALAIIQLNPGISQSALGRAIARDKSTVSPLIKDLQKNGFISRKPSAHDRRSVTLSLTKKGEKTLARLHTRAAEHEEELNRIIGPSKSRFLGMLDKIISGMGQHGAA